MFDQIHKDIEKRMDASIQSSRSEMGGIRAGRASPSMLDSIKVEAYGQKMNINQVANITTPDARTINIDIWDHANVNLVDKSLRESDLGINPTIEGNLIRLPLPQLTEERRKDVAKEAKAVGEEAKVAVRSTRKKANDAVKKKGKDLSEDVAKDAQDQIQKLTDKLVKEIDALVAKKEKEVMTV